MPIPVQRTTTYPSGIHRFLAYNTSNTNFEAFCSSEPKEILKITDERIYTSNITVLGNIEFGADTGILSTRLQVNPARKVFYVDSSTQSIFTLSVDGIFGGYASNADVFVNQNKHSYLNSNYSDYDLTYAFTTGSNTDYTVTLSQAAVFGDTVDITIWPQLIQQSTPLSGYVYQNVSFTYFNKTTPTGSDIYYLGNVGIGTTTPTEKLHINGKVIVGSNVAYINNLVPVADGKINGVNITALNARTRTSKASAVACVSTWTLRTSAADNQWRSVIWAPELSIFVAVSDNGTGNRVMTSPDGITWTAQTSAADNGWRSVTWAPELSLFVAVANTGMGNRVMTSPDGITWTQQTSAVDNPWVSVTWAAELSLFVAVTYYGIGNCVMTSPNGITWTTQTSAADNEWLSVVWAPELSLFVAVAGSGTGNRVMTSPNGITWTLRTSAADNVWSSVTWSPELSLFVAVAYTGTGNRVMTSPDGITWTLRTSATDNPWVSVTWAPELSIFVAVAYTGTGNRVMTSPNGITWTSRTSAADNQWRSVIWAAELSTFVAVSNTGTGNRVMTSAIGMPNSKSVVKALPSQMTVLPSGNVGIGTTLPLANLQIGATAFTDISGTNYYNYAKQLALLGDYNVAPNSGDTIKLYIGNYNNDSAPNVYPILCEDENATLDFFVKARTNSAALPTMYFAGNLGIGNTNPPVALMVSRDATLSASQYAGDNEQGQLYLTGSTNAYKRLALLYDTTTNKAYIQSMIAGTGPTPLILNNAGGYVGIGTATPLSRLTVKNGYSEGQDGGICIDAADSNPYNLRIFSYVQAGSQVGYKFKVNNQSSAVEAICLGYNGYVGIGTTVPIVKLDVDGTIRNTNPSFCVHNRTYNIAGLTSFVKIPFTVATTNIGGHFDTTNSRFIAPVAGRYFFAFTAMSYTSGRPLYKFYKNGVDMGNQLTSYGIIQTYDRGMLNAVFDLVAGNYIEIFVGESIHVDYNQFSGFLIG